MARRPIRWMNIIILPVTPPQGTCMWNSIFPRRRPAVIARRFRIRRRPIKFNQYDESQICYYRGNRSIDFSRYRRGFGLGHERKKLNQNTNFRGAANKKNRQRPGGFANSSGKQWG